MRYIVNIIYIVLNFFRKFVPNVKKKKKMAEGANDDIYPIY